MLTTLNMAQSLSWVRTFISLQLNISDNEGWYQFSIPQILPLKANTLKMISFSKRLFAMGQTRTTNRYMTYALIHCRENVFSPKCSQPYGRNMVTQEVFIGKAIFLQEYCSYSSTKIIKLLVYKLC